MKLSERLNGVVSMVSKGGVVADVGTDHGYVPIYLVENNIVSRAIAMDVNEGPLSIAREHIEEAGLSDKIETRLSDGVANLRTGEAKTIVIAGMGGLLIRKILEDGLGTVYTAKEVILSPQSDLTEVRAFLREKIFAIADEKMIYEDGKYYWILKCIPHRGSVPGNVPEAISARFGEILLKRKDEVFHQYLLDQKKKYEEIIAEMENKVSDPDRMANIRIELEAVREAVEIIES